MDARPGLQALTLLLGLTLGAPQLPAAAPGSSPSCPEASRSLTRASRREGVTTLHPGGRVGRFLDHLAEQLARRLPVPTGGPGSQLGPHLPSARRLRALLETLVLLESAGVHRDQDGRLRTSRTGEHVGFLQLGEAAARDGLGRWRAMDLSPSPPASGGPELRRLWTWNLRLGALHWLELWRRFSPSPEAPTRAQELATLRTMAGYLMGARTSWLRAQEDDFLARAAARPEARRYLRQTCQALEMGADEDWTGRLSGRLTREAGGLEREARQVQARRASLFCRR